MRCSPTATLALLLLVAAGGSAARAGGAARGPSRDRAARRRRHRRERGAGPGPDARGLRGPGGRQAAAGDELRARPRPWALDLRARAPGDGRARRTRGSTDRAADRDRRRRPAPGSRHRGARKAGAAALRGRAGRSRGRDRRGDDQRARGTAGAHAGPCCRPGRDRPRQLPRVRHGGREGGADDARAGGADPAWRPERPAAGHPQPDGRAGEHPELRQPEGDGRSHGRRHSGRTRPGREGRGTGSPARGDRCSGRSPALLGDDPRHRRRRAAGSLLAPRTQAVPAGVGRFPRREGHERGADRAAAPGDRRGHPLGGGRVRPRRSGPHAGGGRRQRLWPGDGAGPARACREAGEGRVARDASAPGPRHRRAPRARHERSRRRARPDARGQRGLLPDRVRAGQREARRPLPQDRAAPASPPGLRGPYARRLPGPGRSQAGRQGGGAGQGGLAVAHRGPGRARRDRGPRGPRGARSPERRARCG